MYCNITLLWVQVFCFVTFFGFVTKKGAFVTFYWTVA
jgi:hypothetical protein